MNRDKDCPATGLATPDFAPLFAAFVKGDRPRSPRQGLSPIPLLELAADDLAACYTEARTHRGGIDDFELPGQ